MQLRMDSGNIVIIRKQSDYDSEDTVIAIVNGGSVTCKKSKNNPTD